MTTPPYAELHARSAYSLLDAASSPEALVERASALDLGALALVDRDDVGGAVRFTVAARKAGIHGILGASLTLEDGSPLPLLVMNRRGWGNLCRLLSDARLTGARGVPRTSLERIATRRDGLFALTGGSDGALAHLLHTQRSRDARDLLAKLRDIFGPHLAVEAWRHQVHRETRLSHRLVALARSLGVPWIVTNDVRYVSAQDHRAHDVLTCLKHKTTLDQANTDRVRLLPNNQWHLKGPAQIAALWPEPDDRAAMARTVSIAERCQFDLLGLRPALPRFRTADGTDRGSDDELLAHLTWQGASDRYGVPLGARQRRQIGHELKIIARLDLAGYFLIVHDVVAWARGRRILCQGRGSAANSAVCYCLGITAVDPIGMDLLFERFLSESRTDPPDTDIDFAHADREQVLQYVYQRYGRRHAAMVCEQITWRGKSAVRDVSRVFGFPPEVGAKMALAVGSCEAREAAKRLAEGGAKECGLDPSDRRVGELIDVVGRLDQLPRHRSIHVGGFVLTAEPLDTVVPIEAASMADRTVIQWDKDDLGPMGLMKLDLLGLGILTLLHKALELIRQGHRLELDLGTIPMDDPEVYAMIGRADTVGLFQLESRAQMNVLPRLRPTRFYDLVVQVALIRPGPIQGQMVHPYIRRRRGEEPITYLHPDLIPALERTLGIPLFQEQGMKVAIAMANFTPAQADQLRKAMGFKRANDHLHGLLTALWAGMIRRGLDKATAFRILEQLEGFANYGFPESHAASFALLAYASAWLKYHYPAEFLAAILNSQPMGCYSPSSLVADARRHGVTVRPLDLLYSGWDSSLEHDVSPPAVRLGVRMVRGLSTAARGQLERALDAGPLASLDAVVFRSGLQDRALTTLARAGAFRSMWPGRRQALWEVLRRLRERGMSLALRRGDEPRVALKAMTLLEETMTDFATLGVSHAHHPMAFHRAALRRQGLFASNDLPKERPGRWVEVAGVVICRQRPESAKGVLFMTLEDELGMINIVVMPDLYRAQRALLASTAALRVTGILELDQGVFNVLGKRFVALKIDSAGPATT